MKKGLSFEKEFFGPVNLIFQQRANLPFYTVQSQVFLCHTEATKIFIGNIVTISLYINTEILPKICQLKRRAYRIGESAIGLISAANNVEQYPPDRICRMLAVEFEVIKRVVFSPAHIHSKRSDKVREQRGGNAI